MFFLSQYLLKKLEQQLVQQLEFICYLLLSFENENTYLTECFEINIFSYLSNYVIIIKLNSYS